MRQLIINMPVENVEKSKYFFETLGLLWNDKLSDENATCFTIEENIIIALLPAAHFKAAIGGNEIAGAKTNEVLLSIEAKSKDEVDTFANRAVAAGGHEVGEPINAGPVYGRAFSDLDGHLWNVFYDSTN